MAKRMSALDAAAKADAAREKQWRAQMDASTLISAQKIMQDRSRKSAADAELKRIAAEAKAAAGGTRKRAR